MLVEAEVLPLELTSTSYLPHFELEAVRELDRTPE